MKGLGEYGQVSAPYLEGPFQCKISAQWNRASSLPASPCHRGPYPTPCCTSRQSSPGRFINKRLACAAFNGREKDIYIKEGGESPRKIHAVLK